MGSESASQLGNPLGQARVSPSFPIVGDRGLGPPIVSDLVSWGPKYTTHIQLDYEKQAVEVLSYAQHVTNTHLNLNAQ